MCISRSTSFARRFGGNGSLICRQSAGSEIWIVAINPAPLSREEFAPLSLESEPIVRVGVVLARDNRSQIFIETPEDGYSVAGPTDIHALTAKGQMSIEASEGRLRFNADAFARSGFRSLRLTPAAVARSRPTPASSFGVSLPAGDFIGARNRSEVMRRSRVQS